TPALVAGASLLVDYVLTVAVSVSAGVAAITSAVKPLAEHRIELGRALILAVPLGNLRARRGAPQAFAARRHTDTARSALLLVRRPGPTLAQDETILSILGTAVFGRGVLYSVLQAATAAILTLAANTAFSGFPLLASIIAQDGYLPRQLATRGDRLAFSNGIVGLAAGASILLVAFGGVTTALIPLYAVGVFTSFTLSQWGMVQRHRRLRAPGWRLGAAVN